MERRCACRQIFVLRIGNQLYFELKTKYRQKQYGYSDMFAVCLCPCIRLTAMRMNIGRQIGLAVLIAFSKTDGRSH